MSCQLPAELLKIRLNQQLSRLKENLNGNNNNNNNNNSATAAITRNDEDKFTLYQRIVSWFIMGRLSKYEYDRVLESLLETSEQIELHNRVLELLRVIHCDYQGFQDGSIDAALCQSLPAFAFNLLPPRERQLLVSVEDMSESGSSASEPPSGSLSTAVKLTASEELLISEAMRNPVLPLTFPPTSSSVTSSVPTDRQLSELGRFMGHAEMRARIATIAETEGIDLDGDVFDDGVAVLVCKAVEDFVKNLIQNAWELKFHSTSTLQPPESYIFGSSVATTTTQSDTDKTAIDTENEQRSSITDGADLLTEKDFQVLLKLKPWLLADFLPEFCE